MWRRVCCNSASHVWSWLDRGRVHARSLCFPSPLLMSLFHRPDTTFCALDVAYASSSSGKPIFLLNKGVPVSDQSYFRTLCCGAMGDERAAKRMRAGHYAWESSNLSLFYNQTARNVYIPCLCQVALVNPTHTSLDLLPVSMHQRIPG